MGKLGRIACIATPMALTIASLICLLFVFLGGINKDDGTLRGLYFFKANTTALKDNVTNTDSIFDNTGINPSLLSALKAAVQDDIIADYYEIYMWNYCSGNNNASVPSFCSPRKAEFYFNPLTEWGLNSTTLEALLPSDLKNGISLYSKVSKWMFIAYTVAFWTTASAIVVGIFATCSRWGSCLTWIVSSISTLFTILSAATSTALFSTLVGTFDSALKPYDIALSLGTSQLALDWLAVAFSIVATSFWFISICCCSGKSPHSHPSKRNGGGNAPYSVQRQPTFPFLNRGYSKLGEEQHGVVGQEYGAQPFGAPPQRDLEMHDYAQSGTAAVAGQGPYKGRESAYEPFRHQRGPSAVSDVEDV